MALSELAAVNRILIDLGKLPVNSIVATDTNADARMAENKLNSVLSDVQREEWHYNRDEQYTLSATSDTGEVLVPSNTITFVCDEEPWITVRDGKLYDRQNQTSVLETAKTGTIVQELEWDSVPEYIRAYAAARAARELYAVIGDGNTTQLQILIQNERAHRATALHHETEMARYTMFDAQDFPHLYGSEYVPGSTRYRRY